MSLSNKELVSKADLALADLTSNGGRLNTEQTGRFIRKLIDSPTILRKVRTVAMPSESMRINKIWFGNPILQAAVQTAGSRATHARSAPTTEKVELSTKELIAEVRIPYEVLEENIEGGRVDASLQEGAGGLHQTIVDLIGERVALDLEDLLIVGDTAGSGATGNGSNYDTYPYLKVLDGYLKLATAQSSPSVAAAGALFSKDLVKAAVKAMPDRYLRDRGSLLHFVSVDNETELRDQYSNRQTAAGDANLQGELPLRVFGSPVQPAARMPGTKSLYCNPLNLIFGVQRNVLMEFDKIIAERVYQIVVTMRVAAQIEEKDALVVTTGMTAP